MTPSNEDIPQSMLKRLPPNVWAATITSFLTDVSSEMIFNLIPLFLSNVLGASTAVIGLIDGVAETTASLLKGVSGWLSDKLGKRKRLAVIGYGLSSVAKPFLYFATSWYAVLAVRFVDRAGKGIRTSPRDALIADSINEDQRGIAFGLHRAGDTAGAMLGLMIALVVVVVTQSSALQLSRDTFQWLVVLSIVPGFLSVAVLAWKAQDVPIPEKKSTGEEAADENKARLGFWDLNRDFRIFLLIMAIFTLGNSSDAFIILRAQERGLSVVGVLGMLITFSLVYAVFSGPLGALSDRVGRFRLIVGGWLAYGVLYLGFAAVSATWQIWVVYAMYGLYYAAVEGTAKALVADLIPREQRGTAYGYYNATVGLVALPASLMAGVLWQGLGGWDGLGPSAPFLAGAVLALVAVGLMVGYGPRGRGEMVAAR